MAVRALVFASVNVDRLYACGGRSGETSDCRDTPTNPRHGNGPTTIVAHTAHAPALGGKGANQALALWRAGADVLVCGSVGADGLCAAGVHLSGCGCGVSTAGLERSGCAPLRRSIDGRTLSLRDVRTVRAAATGHVVVALDDARETVAVLHPGANARNDVGHLASFVSRHLGAGRVSAADLVAAAHTDTAHEEDPLLTEQREQIPSAEEAHPGDSTAIFVVQGETNLQAEALRMARAASAAAVLAYNPAPVPPLSWRGVPRVDWLFVNEDEAALVLGGERRASNSDLDATLRALAETTRARNVLLTLGARGSAARIGHTGETLAAPAHPVRRVVDATGAGDAYVGYFLAALYGARWVPRCPGQSLGGRVAAAMRVASAAAALTVLRIGAAPPEHDEVLCALADSD